MEIGIQTGFNDFTPPELIADYGRIIEECGFRSLWLPEHVLFFQDYASRYPYAADGKIPGDPTGVMEPFTALAFVAANTERLRLGTGICIVPQRNPIYTAKQVADLDYLSQGRVDFGIGVGWLREEFAALGVPFERRAARTRECIEVMKTLWCDEVSQYEGEFYRLPPCLQNPKPTQKPHPPIVIGGDSDPALRRVAEYGDGWFGYQLTDEALAECLKRMDGFLAEAGRSRADLSIHVGPVGSPDRAAVERYADLGVDELILPLFARDAAGLRKRAEGLAGEVL